MCTGTTTLLTCGHRLTHFTTRCPAACPELPPAAGPTRRLPDTCAACHPAHRIELALRRHDTLQRFYTAEHRLALADGRPVDADELRCLMDRRRAETYGEVAAARRRGAGGLAGVVWPGKGVDDDGL